MANTKQCYRGTTILRSDFLLSEVHLSLFGHCSSSVQTDTEGLLSVHEAAFRTLKSKLTSAPVLTYPRFDKRASLFVLQTDASAVGLGAILQQDGYVIGYVSRVLSKSEANYCVIQRECWAVRSSCGLIMNHYNGSPARKWKACFVDGPWHCRSMISE